MTEQERQDLLSRITIDPGVQGGRPVIRGTRMLVARVLGALSSGATYEELREDYGLSELDIRAALAYAAREVAYPFS